MNIAVIETGGKQYLVKEGSVITIEKLPGDLKKDDTVTFDSVLMADDGSALTFGGSKVTGTVLDAGRNKKVVVVKYKAKSRYYKKRGHKQPHLKVKISSLS